MIIHGSSLPFFFSNCTKLASHSLFVGGVKITSSSGGMKMNFRRSSCCRLSVSITGFLAVMVIMNSSSITTAAAAATFDQQQEADTLSNIPQTLSAEEKTKPRIQRPKSRKAESCTIKCVTTCIRGGEGSPGEGPFNVRRPLVVFKKGFRSRQYCLVECSDICNLIGDGDDGP